jgi:serine/threonine protein kinase
MNEDTWKRARPVLEQVLGLDAAAQSARVEELCGDDDELRERVLGLLQEEREDRDFLVSLRPPDAPEREPGTSCGPWRLVRPLGHGGMGVVWLAERADGEYEQQVAIKFVSPAIAGAEVLPRLKRERRALARLEHPSIARLIDGGAAPDGTPFLAMELVEGQALDRWCDERRLPLRERLELFRGVCAAVAHAHANFVLHCDIKPANILVNTAGEPKLLDFGIAKLLEGADDGDVDTTRTGERPMTPLHAGPEQFAGEAPTVATDVYQLGVLLYQQLTGRLPYDLETGSFRELAQAVTEGAVVRASAAIDRPDTRSGPPEERARSRGLSTTRLRRELEGDLDLILHRALHREPAQRYASVEQLAEDVRRYLDSLPVLARPDSVVYRAGKFVRRNRTLVTAGLALFVSLSAGLAVSARMYVRAEDARVTAENARTTANEATAVARRERAQSEAARKLAEEERGKADAARARAEEAEEVTARRFSEVRKLSHEMVWGIYDRIRTLPGSTAASEYITGVGVTFLDRLSAEKPEDSGLLWELAAGYQRVGDVLGRSRNANLGQYEAALGHYRTAREMYDAAIELAPDHPTLSYERSVANARLGSAQLELGRPREALATFTRGCDALEVHHERFPEFQVTFYRSSQAAMRCFQGNAHYELGQLEEALKSYRDALEKQRALLEALNTANERRNYEVYVHKIARTLRTMGRAEEALPYAEELVMLGEEHLAATPHDVEVIRDQSTNLQVLGQTSVDLGRFDDAHYMLDRSIELTRGLMASDPENRQARYDLTLAMGAKARAFEVADEPTGAVEVLVESVAVLEALWSERAENLWWGRTLCSQRTRLAESRLLADDLDAAAGDAEAVLERLATYADDDQARPWCEALSLRSHLVRARVHEERDEADQARDRMQLAFELLPDSEQPWTEERLERAEVEVRDWFSE